MSNQPAPVVKAENPLQRFREYVAALISLLIIGGALFMLAQAFRFVASDDGSFERVKDLLLFINPLLGVVIGYYFNKVSTEARAESAESSALSATATAQDAMQQRQEAVADAEQAKQAVGEMQDTLVEVSAAAEQMASQVDAAGGGAGSGLVGGTLSAGGEAGGADWAQSRAELNAALARARRAQKRWG